MKTTWKITTFENGRPAARHEGVSHEEAISLIARAQDSTLDVERELSASERRERSVRVAA
jgi:hypothetical protein